MNKHEFDNGYSQLFSYYQSKNNTAKYDVWWQKLRSFPPSAFLAAVDQWIEGERYFPTLVQIKATTFRCMTPAEMGVIHPDFEISENEQRLNMDLFPLFTKYLNGKTSLEDWKLQMQYFADIHGVGDAVRVSIDHYMSDDSGDSWMNPDSIRKA